MIAAAVVLLAAHFEEYVRQKIEEYAKAIIEHYPDFNQAFSRKIVGYYWKSSVVRLGRFRPEHDSGWEAGASGLLNSIQRYPIASDTTQFVAANLSVHDNNMRMDTILELAARVGIKKLAELMGKRPTLRTAINEPRISNVGEVLRERLKTFYDQRNEIVHSISQHRGMGSADLENWIAFFKAFSTAFSSALDASLTQFSSDIAKAKARRTA